MVKISTADNFTESFERIRKETGIKSIRQLAEIIEKDHTTLLAAKKKKDFPAGWAYVIEKKYGLLTGWIMTGEGPKRIYGEDKRLEILSEFEEWILEEIRKEPEKKIWFKIQIQESFPGFKTWKEEKEGRKEIQVDSLSQKVA